MIKPAIQILYGMGKADWKKLSEFVEEAIEEVPASRGQQRSVTRYLAEKLGLKITQTVSPLAVAWMNNSVQDIPFS